MLSLGLCIDFCTHIAHSHWAGAGASTARAAAALGARGAAVLNAGLSTLVAISMMGLASSQITYTFFKMFCGMVIVGMCHALLVLPACLSLLPFAASSARPPMLVPV